MRLPRFRIWTLMIAVAILGALLAIVVLAQDASPINQTLVVCGAVFFALGIAIPVAAIRLLDSLLMLFDRPPAECGRRESDRI